MSVSQLGIAESDKYSEKQIENLQTHLKGCKQAKPQNVLDLSLTLSGGHHGLEYNIYSLNEL